MHRAPLTSHHADNSTCPPEHKHTTSGKPLTQGCPGRAYAQARCSCGNWQMKDAGKGYVNESRRRHLASHPKPTPPEPRLLGDLLRLDTP
ncbi:hypothetical protein [Streptomyces sp. H39-S7]|uniref:hypothetical protein n=1 Tax=Streptomyces sp. H39-S7 TaxID=3004357 RepID=UPI0022AF9BF4|nr:hypothetical protein [Streptomyces sp. H39-S7]MCZ4122684.1 hypothetical protein [Streptomyces sp. H39-S7]